MKWIWEEAVVAYSNIYSGKCVHYLRKAIKVSFRNPSSCAKIEEGDSLPHSTNKKQQC
jgi:hypothetical protein